MRPAVTLELAVLLSALAVPAGAGARQLHVGPGQAYRMPSAAAAAAREGDEVLIHPGVYRDCATWTADGLTITGVGGAARVVIGSKVCEDKAIFVAKGDGITVQNLTLTRASVPWGNGAGIRGEGKDLVVDRVRFIRNENGILSGTVGGSMHVLNSVFDRNGRCLEACAHGVYVGRLDRLVVSGSRFLRTREGHHIKSRALRTEVTDCVIRDGPTGTSSYEIEAPNGGALFVRRNRLEKGPLTSNAETAISIGAEGVKNPTPQILVEDNRFRNDSLFPVAFVTNLTDTSAVLRDNRLQGPVVALRGKGRVTSR